MNNDETKDLAEARLAKLRQLLRAHKIMRVEDLAGSLRVSSATVRRDLVCLERGGELRRVHGGAVALESRIDEPGFDDKASLAAREKKRIAEAARRRIRPNDAIFLDGGSTVLALAALLAGRSDITVVTNSLRVAAELAGAGPRLILVGGELRRLSQTFVGPLTRLTLEHLHVDRAFIGTIGLSLIQGLTTTDPQEAYTKSLIMAHARQVILLADRSKLGQVSFARFGDLERIRTLITDRGMDPQMARDLRKKGIEIEIV